MYTVMHKRIHKDSMDYAILAGMPQHMRPAGIVRFDKHGATEVYPIPGSIVANHDNTRFYEVQKNGSVRRIAKPE